MPVLVVQVSVHVRHGIGVLCDNILVKASPQRDVDQLQPAAYAQHRPPLHHAFPEQLHLVQIAHAVARPFRPGRRFAIGDGAHIRAALQDEAVYFPHIVADAHLRALDAPGFYRRQHEYQCAAPHDPVRDGLFEVLQGLVAKAEFRRRVMQNAWRQANP